MIITLIESKGVDQMTNQIVTQSANDDINSIVKLVIDGLTSEHSKRAYKVALNDFIVWYVEAGKPGLNKAIVQEYRTVLQHSGLSGSSINLKISAIRKLAQEAGDNGLIEQHLANGISKVKGVKSSGIRSGNWLTKDQAQELINSPDTSTLKGLRDRAILAIMIGGGLRRSEVAELTFDHIQMRDGRWIIVDLIGKGNRVRSIPIPNWVKVAIDEWTKAANIDPTGNIFRRINKGDNVVSGSITPQAIRDIVIHYSSKLGYPVAAHDLRRTFAKLAHKGGAGLDQIQLSLGHVSIKTTENYLGVEQSLTDAPCDLLGLKLD
jgi:site-specific recombinase XerD